MPLVALTLVCACGRLEFSALQDAAKDAPAKDGAIDGDDGDARSACVGWDVCEDFESGAIGAAWTVDPTVVLDTAFAHRGTRSARMHVNATAVGQYQSSHMYEVATLAPVPAETWTRAYIRLGALPAGNNALELMSIEHNGGGPAGQYTFVRAGSFEMYVEPALTTVPTGTAAATNVWYCFVLHVVFSTASTGSASLAGDAAASLTNTTTNDSVTPVDALSIGPYLAGPNVSAAQPAFDVWVDDVIVHHAPITCAD